MLGESLWLGAAILTVIFQPNGSHVKRVLATPPTITEAVAGGAKFSVALCHRSGASTAMVLIHYDGHLLRWSSTATVIHCDGHALRPSTIITVMHCNGHPPLRCSSTATVVKNKLMKTLIQAI